ncbi:MAG: hypothetical protein HQM09_10420 [Candidatus Riflebacteria bacterium]|nr:hypothetical protein [Candidatus Riflebacteria bacterium]
MRRFFLMLLFVICFHDMVFAASDSASCKVTTIDMIRYEAGLASTAQRPFAIMHLSFGAGDDQVGGCDQDGNHRTEGVPYAYIPLADGSVWILDTIQARLKRFSPAGKMMTAVSFSVSGGGVNPLIRDFALAPKDGFYLLCATDGKVRRISATGEAVVEIEGLNDTQCIGSDPKGNILVKNAVLNGLLRFNPDGELIERYEGQNDLSVVTDLECRPYGIHGDETQALVFKATVASPAEELVLATFSLEIPRERGAHYVSRKIIGVDAARNIYVELVACDDNGVIHLNRLVKLSPTGSIIARADILSSPYMAVDLPRRLTVTPDGHVMGFSVDLKGWTLTGYKLP